MWASQGGEQAGEKVDFYFCRWKILAWLHLPTVLIQYEQDNEKITETKRKHKKETSALSKKRRILGETRKHDLFKLWKSRLRDHFDYINNLSQWKNVWLLTALQYNRATMLWTTAAWIHKRNNSSDAKVINNCNKPVA